MLLSRIYIIRSQGNSSLSFSSTVLGLLFSFLFIQPTVYGQNTLANASAYRLQPNDSFTVLYRLTPEYNQTVTVQPNGDVTLQLIGSVNVKDLTLDDAAHIIRKHADLKLNKPDVSLELKDFDKPHFVVLGEVASPGRIELHGHLTVADGLAMAGGLKISARHNNIILLRPLNSEIAEAHLIDFKALEKQNNNTQSTLLPSLEAGDIVIVPTSKLSKVERYVKIVNTGVYYNPGNF